RHTRFSRDWSSDVCSSDLFTYDRDKESLRIENEETGKGTVVALSGIVAKWHEQKEKAIDEVVYYVENALNVMGKEHAISGSEKRSEERRVGKECRARRAQR